MKKHLSTEFTDFKKVILEKLNKKKRKEKDDEIEEVEPDEEIEEPTDDEEPEIEYQDDDEGLEDDVINELLNEYKKIKRKHELYKLHRRGK